MSEAKLTYITGDAAEPTGDGMKFIVHSCNDRGYFGAGFAKHLANKWRLAQRAYLEWAKRAHEQNDALPLGAIQMLVVEDDIRIVNLIGQSGLKSRENPVPVDYRALVDGFEKIAVEALKAGASIHCPKLGAGLGGGDWNHIEKLLKIGFVEKGIDVFVYELPAKKNQGNLFK